MRYSQNIADILAVAASFKVPNKIFGISQNLSQKRSREEVNKVPMKTPMFDDNAT